MLVFFTASYIGDKTFGHYYKEIYKLIEELGCQHLDDETMYITYEQYIKKMKKGIHAQVENYKETLNFIKSADICILETSAHSLGLGYIVQKSLELGKPTIVLYYEDNTPFFLAGIKDEKLILKSYTGKNLKRILKQSITLAKERRDKRFNFYLSTKLLEYVENLSKEEGVTKSKTMRDIILRDMRQKDNN